MKLDHKVVVVGLLMVPLLYGSEISILDFLVYTDEVFTTYLVITFKQKFFRVEKECTRQKNINKTVQYITPTLHIFIKCGKACRVGLF